MEDDGSRKNQTFSKNKSKKQKQFQAEDFHTDDQLLSIVRKRQYHFYKNNGRSLLTYSGHIYLSIKVQIFIEKKGKKGKGARASLVSGKLVEIEKELKAIEEDAVIKRNNDKSKANDSSHDDDPEDETTGTIGN